jgi:hypothetical protein
MARYAGHALRESYPELFEISPQLPVGVSHESEREPHEHSVQRTERDTTRAAGRRGVRPQNLCRRLGLPRRHDHRRPLLVSGTAEAVEAPGTTVGLTVNGRHQRIPVDNRTSLLDLLRERAGLTGPKKGCNQGACGACTVLLDGKRVNSCLTLAVMHEGAQVTTIEGLADGENLHPLQSRRSSRKTRTSAAITTRHAEPLALNQWVCSLVEVALRLLLRRTGAARTALHVKWKTYTKDQVTPTFGGSGSRCECSASRPGGTNAHRPLRRPSIEGLPIAVPLSTSSTRADYCAKLTRLARPASRNITRKLQPLRP